MEEEKKVVWQPRNDLIVVKPDKKKSKAQRKTETGIVIPDGGWIGDVSDGSFEGTVLRIGNKVRDIYVGDRILYTVFSIKQKLNDNEFLMREKDVLGVIE